MSVFFETPKSLADLNPEQWESLCDGCGLCCLQKLQDEDSDEVFFTDLACPLLDRDTCRCRDYPNRARRMPECMQLAAERMPPRDWLPRSCAYRRVQEGRGLALWHPLRSGNPESVHAAGISVRGRVRNRDDVAEADWEDHIIHWVD